MALITQPLEVMPFGKYKGTAITELKLSYVNWLLTLDNLKVRIFLYMNVVRTKNAWAGLGLKGKYHEFKYYFCGSSIEC